MGNSPNLLLNVFCILVCFISTNGSSDRPLMSMEGHNFTQRLSHFELGGKYDNVTFQQTYLIVDVNWSTNKGPIFVFFGGDSPIATYVGSIGLLERAAPRLNGLAVYVEHRFYGDSVPFGSIEAALASPPVRSHLNAEEALADFACLIRSLKANLSAPNSPVIVLGSSYSGILAAWFRLKYPDIAVGALASSAPMLFSQVPAPGNDFCSIITRDFEHVNPSCSNIIRQSWNRIDEIASRPEGLAVLSKTFNLCSGRTLRSSHELKVILANVYSDAAILFTPFNNRVKSICDTVMGASTNNNALEGIARALSAINNGTCVDHLNSSFGAPFKSFEVISQLAWNWQSCSEIPILRSCNGNNSIIPQEAFHSQARHYKGCWRKYHTLPSRNWLWIDQSGSQDIKELGSNIIFSNGLRDPYSSLGILDNISDTIVALNTKEGFHCQEMTAAQETESLTELMEMEIIIFKRWIEEKNGAKKAIFHIHLLVLVLFSVLVCLCI